MTFKNFSFVQFDSGASLSLGLTTGKVEEGVHVNNSCASIDNSACTANDIGCTLSCQSIQSSNCASYRR